MVAIQIQDEQLVKRLQELSVRENRSIEDVLQMLLNQYTNKINALNSMDGMFDDDISDLSTSVRDTMNSYYLKRNENSD